MSEGSEGTNEKQLLFHYSLLHYDSQLMFILFFSFFSPLVGSLKHVQYHLLFVK